MAVMVDVPTDTPVTRPWSLTVAISGLLEVHVIVLSVTLAGEIVATNCVVEATNIVSSFTLSEIDVATTGLTVTSQVAFDVPLLAVMVAVPRLKAVTTPVDDTEATLGLSDPQATVLSVVLSGKTEAVSSTWSPNSIDTDVGEITMPSEGTGITVTVQVAETVPHLAVMIAVPILTAVTVPSALISAMSVSDDTHSTSG